MNIGKLKLDFTHFVIIAIGIGALILMKNCSGNGAAIASLKHRADSLEKLEAETWKNFAIAHNALNDTVRILNGQKELAEAEAQNTKNNLTLAEMRIDQILKDHKPIKPNDTDTGYFLVPNEYVVNCEGCIMELKNGKDSVKKYISQRDSVDIISKKQLRLYQGLADTLRKALYNEHAAFTEMNNIAEQALKKAASRTHLYTGIEYFYSPVVANIGAWLQFTDKKNHSYGINAGGNSLSSWYIGARIGTRIF